MTTAGVKGLKQPRAVRLCVYIKYDAHIGPIRGDETSLRVMMCTGGLQYQLQRGQRHGSRTSNDRHLHRNQFQPKFIDGECLRQSPNSFEVFDTGQEIPDIRRVN